MLPRHYYAIDIYFATPAFRRAAADFFFFLARRRLGFRRYAMLLRAMAPCASCHGVDLRYARVKRVARSLAPRCAPALRHAFTLRRHYDIVNRLHST